MEPENTLLDDFILALARRQPARICFIPTASADSANYIVKFYRAFTGRAIPVDLTLFDAEVVSKVSLELAFTRRERSESNELTVPSDVFVDRCDRLVVRDRVVIDERSGKLREVFVDNSRIASC